jgi:hypothetical protein
MQPDGEFSLVILPVLIGFPYAGSEWGLAEHIFPECEWL